jgi:PAS domain S-box-containing protein
VAFFLLAMTPLVAFSVFMIYRSAQEERATFRRGAVERTRAMMTAVDAQLQSSITKLEALATSEALDRGDLQGFYDVAMRVFISQPDWRTINLSDASAHRLMDLLYPFGSSNLPPVAEAEAVKRAFETQTIAIGNLVLGPTTRQLDFGIRVPVVRDGRTKYVLSAVVKPDSIAAPLLKQKLPAGWLVGVLDGNRRIVARTFQPESAVGQFAAESLRAELARSAEGWARGRTIEGSDIYRAYSRSQFSGWSVSMAIPAAVVDAPLQGTPLIVALFGSGLMLLGVALALVFSRRTAESIESLTGMAEALPLTEHAKAETAASGIAEVDRLRDALGTTQRLIEERVKERDAFERELWQQASLLELSHDAIFVFEYPVGPIVYWNRGAETLYGYTKAEAIGRSPRELLKTVFPRGREAVIAALEKNGEYIGEMIHTARDGRKVHVESRHVLAPEADGRRLVLETCRDMSERLTEERRAQVQAGVDGILALARNLADAAPKLVELLGTAGDWDMCSIWDWDAAAEEFVCIESWISPSVDLAAFKAATLGHRTKLRARKGLLGRVMESGEPTWIADAAADLYYARRAVAATHDIHAAFCFPVKLADRVLGFVECYGRETRAPNPDFVDTLASIGAELGQFIERTRAEAENRLLSRLPAENPAPVIRLTAAGVISFGNPAAAAVLGEWNTALGSDAPPAIVDIARVALAEKKKRTVDLVLRECAYTVTFAPISDADYVNLYFTDITDRRRAEEELKRLNEELESRVQTRTAELERSLAERASLEAQLRQAQKMEALGTLAGGIAHDFNNILGIVLGWARELAEEQGSSEALDAIISSGERGAAIVKQMLAFSRRQAIAEKPVAMNRLVSDTSPMLKAIFPKTIEFEIALEESLPDILGDAHQLQQALINICINARDAMPEGGRLIIRTARAGSDAPATAAAGDYIRVEISDTGFGMDEATRSRIFEPFFTTKQAGGGTGLGLAVVYGIVQAHGGAIDLVSAPGGGTTFKLYLPIPARPPEETARPKATEPIAGSGTLLVIDDEPLLARLVKEAAERRGFRVLTAGDGLEAVATFEKHAAEIDGVVLDCGLPKMSGPEVFRRLKELKPDIVVIGVTGYLDPEVKSRLLQEGVREFLHKPCSPDEILAKLQSCLTPA